MPMTDFDFEFTSEVELTDSQDTEMRVEAERRLRELAADHNDMIGAAVALERVAHGETPHFYQARVVAYIRPDNIAAVEKENSALTALQGALDAVERQVREKRARLREQQRQPR